MISSIQTSLRAVVAWKDVLDDCMMGQCGVVAHIGQYRPMTSAREAA